MLKMQSHPFFRYSGLYFTLDSNCEERIDVEIKKEKINTAFHIFFSNVRKKAYRIAYVSTGTRDDALDIVQDSMYKLIDKYASKPVSEWHALFYTILYSRIKDWHRRSKVRNRFKATFGFFSDNDKPGNELELYQNARVSTPECDYQTQENIRALENSIHQLPFRQQQAFLLRAWQGLSIKETAIIMQCSQGSVKTHYSRAKSALQKYLGDLYK